MDKQKKLKISKISEHIFRKEAAAFMKVVYWFFAHPDREISLNDLTKNVSISKSTANKIVTKLVKEGFLKKEVLGKVWRISCGISHPYNTMIKIPHNLQLAYTSGIIELILKQIPNARAIILFGSYRKGDDNDKSDLDIAVEVLGEKEVKIFNFGVLPEFGYRKDVPVNVHIFSRESIDLHLFSNIANGIILWGFLEVKP